MQLADAMLLVKGGAGAIIAGSLYLLGQWIAKRKPKHLAEVEHHKALLGLQADERSAYDARLSSLGRELDVVREKMNNMERKLDRLTAERHYSQNLFLQLSMDHPAASAQIFDGIQKMRELFGDD